VTDAEQPYAAAEQSVAHGHDLGHHLVAEQQKHAPDTGDVQRFGTGFW